MAALGDRIRSWPRALRSDAAGRMRWGVVDQCLSSVTNFAVMVAAARQAGRGEFGAFSLAMAVYIFVLWIARSLAAEPFVVRLTESSPDQQRASAREALGAAVAVGAAAGLMMVGFGVATGPVPGRALVLMGLFLPPLLAQDFYRYVLLVAGRTRAAAANDCAWLLLLAAATALLGLVHEVTVLALLAAFGVSGTLAGLLGARQTGVPPALPAPWRWLRRHRDLAVPYALELVAVNGMAHVAMIGVAAIAGVAAVGDVRAAMLLLSPLTVLFAGLFMVGTPEAVRLRRRSSRALWHFVTITAAGTTAAIVLWAAAIAVVPDGLGTAVLGSNWHAARDLLVPITVWTTGSACALSAVMGLRALRAARRSLAARAWVAPLTLVAALGGAALGDAYGAGVGLAVASVVGALVAARAFRYALSHPEESANELGDVAAAAPAAVRP